jgi:hypothetical protein
MKIPTYEEAEKAHAKGVSNPLDEFVLSNEPAGKVDNKLWHVCLKKMIDFIEGQKTGYTLPDAPAQPEVAKFDATQEEWDRIKEEAEGREEQQAKESVRKDMEERLIKEDEEELNFEGISLDSNLRKRMRMNPEEQIEFDKKLALEEEHDAEEQQAEESAFEEKEKE